MFLIAAIIVLISMINKSGSLGINCRGSLACEFEPTSAISRIHDQVLALPPWQEFRNEEHIACAGKYNHVCAFYQNLDGTQTAGDASLQLAKLLSHGCYRCGSYPVSYNDVAYGELTVNYVFHQQQDDDTKVGMFDDAVKHKLNPRAEFAGS